MSSLLSHYPLLLYHRLTCFAQHPAPCTRSCLATPVLPGPLHQSPSAPLSTTVCSHPTSPGKPFQTSLLYIPLLKF